MSARESLTEVFGEGGHGDNSQRFADELYAEIRAEVLREAADALEARVADDDVDTKRTWAGMDAAYLRRLADEAVR